MYHPASDRKVEGVVSEVNGESFRVGTDDNKSIEFGFRQTELDRWDVEILDRSGEIRPTVIEKLPGRDADYDTLAELTHDDPVQSIPSNTTIVDPEKGYDQHDSEVAASLAGAHLDDEAEADATRDNLGAHYLDKMTTPHDLTPEDQEKVASLLGTDVPKQTRRLIVTLHLPLPLTASGKILAAIGEVFPNATVLDDDGGPEDEMRVYAPVEDT